MHAPLRGSKSLLTLNQIIKKTNFPSVVDEIAEPHPDMNIKAAAFTVSVKSINTSDWTMLTSLNPSIPSSSRVMSILLRRTDSHSDYSADQRLVQLSYIAIITGFIQKAISPYYPYL